MARRLDSLDILSKREVENFPGRIGDAADVGGGILELDPRTQQKPPRLPEGPYDSFTAATKWRVLIKLNTQKRNPVTGLMEDKRFSVSARVKCRWISEDGLEWQRFVLFR